MEKKGVQMPKCMATLLQFETEQTRAKFESLLPKYAIVREIGPQLKEALAYRAAELSSEKNHPDPNLLKVCSEPEQLRWQLQRASLSKTASPAVRKAKFAEYWSRNNELGQLMLSCLRDLADTDLEAICGRLRLRLHLFDPGQEDVKCGAEFTDEAVVLRFKGRHLLLYSEDQFQLGLARKLKSLPLAVRALPQATVIEKLVAGKEKDLLRGDCVEENALSREEGSIVISKFSRPEQRKDRLQVELKEVKEANQNSVSSSKHASRVNESSTTHEVKPNDSNVTNSLKPGEARTPPRDWQKKADKLGVQNDRLSDKGSKKQPATKERRLSNHQTERKQEKGRLLKCLFCRKQTEIGDQRTPICSQNKGIERNEQAKTRARLPRAEARPDRAKYSPSYKDEYQRDYQKERDFRPKQQLRVKQTTQYRGKEMAEYRKDTTQYRGKDISQYRAKEITQYRSKPHWEYKVKREYPESPRQQNYWERQEYRGFSPIEGQYMYSYERKGYAGLGEHRLFDRRQQPLVKRGLRSVERVRSFEMSRPFFYLGK